MNAGSAKPVPSGAKSGKGPTAFAKVAAPLATDFTKLYEPGALALAELAPEQSPTAFFVSLRAAGLDQEAITFLAYALPPRELLWWGVRAIREAKLPNSNVKVEAALVSVDEWIATPDDSHRRAAMSAAESATFETPAGCLALGVFLSGGSMSPPDCPPVPVGEGFCAKTVSAAMILCTLAQGVPDPIALTRVILDLGVDVATDPAPWDEAGGSGARVR